jgi:hypothetical protein
MDDIKIITAYCIVADTLHALGHCSDPRAQVSDAEVLWIAIVSAMYFHNHHQRTLWVLHQTRWLSHPLSPSRFNRRLHALATWLEFLPDLVGQLFGQHEAYIIDSMPVPVCELARAPRCRKLRGPDSLAFFGRCAAKRRHFFGWRLHLIVSADGIPVSFQLLPASFHDLTPIHELTWVLPEGATLYGDAAYVSAATQRALRATVRRPHGVAVVARHRKNMRPNTWLEREGLRAHRQRVETVNAQLTAMGVQRLHARTDAGLALKVLASLLAVACINLN